MQNCIHTYICHWQENVSTGKLFLKIITRKRYLSFTKAHAVCLWEQFYPVPKDKQHACAWVKLGYVAKTTMHFLQPLQSNYNLHASLHKLPFTNYIYSLFSY